MEDNESFLSGLHGSLRDDHETGEDRARRKVELRTRIEIMELDMFGS